MEENITRSTMKVPQMMAMESKSPLGLDMYDSDVSTPRSQKSEEAVPVANRPEVETAKEKLAEVLVGPAAGVSTAHAAPEQTAKAQADQPPVEHLATPVSSLSEAQDGHLPVEQPVLPGNSPPEKSPPEVQDGQSLAGQPQSQDAVVAAAAVGVSPQEEKPCHSNKTTTARVVGVGITEVVPGKPRFQGQSLPSPPPAPVFADTDSPSQTEVIKAAVDPVPHTEVPNSTEDHAEVLALPTSSGALELETPVETANAPQPDDVPPATLRSPSRCPEQDTAILPEPPGTQVKSPGRNKGKGGRRIPKSPPGERKPARRRTELAMLLENEVPKRHRTSQSSPAPKPTTSASKQDEHAAKDQLRQSSLEEPDQLPDAGSTPEKDTQTAADKIVSKGFDKPEEAGSNEAPPNGVTMEAPGQVNLAESMPEICEHCHPGQSKHSNDLASKSQEEASTQPTSVQPSEHNILNPSAKARNSKLEEQKVVGAAAGKPEQKAGSKRNPTPKSQIKQTPSKVKKQAAQQSKSSPKQTPAKTLGKEPGSSSKERAKPETKPPATAEKPAKAAAGRTKISKVSPKTAKKPRAKAIKKAGTPKQNATRAAQASPEEEACKRPGTRKRAAPQASKLSSAERATKKQKVSEEDTIIPSSSPSSEQTREESNVGASQEPLKEGTAVCEPLQHAQTSTQPEKTAIRAGPAEQAASCLEGPSNQCVAAVPGLLSDAVNDMSAFEIPDSQDGAIEPLPGGTEVANLLNKCQLNSGPVTSVISNSTEGSKRSTARSTASGRGYKQQQRQTSKFTHSMLATSRQAVSPTRIQNTAQSSKAAPEPVNHSSKDIQPRTAPGTDLAACSRPLPRLPEDEPYRDGEAGAQANLEGQASTRDHFRTRVESGALAAKGKVDGPEMAPQADQHPDRVWPQQAAEKQQSKVASKQGPSDQRLPLATDEPGTLSQKKPQADLIITHKTFLESGLQNTKAATAPSSSKRLADGRATSPPRVSRQSFPVMEAPPTSKAPSQDRTGSSMGRPKISQIDPSKMNAAGPKRLQGKTITTGQGVVSDSQKTNVRSGTNHAVHLARQEQPNAKNCREMPAQQAKQVRSPLQLAAAKANAAQTTATATAEQVAPLNSRKRKAPEPSDALPMEQNQSGLESKSAVPVIPEAEQADKANKAAQPEQAQVASDAQMGGPASRQAASRKARQLSQEVQQRQELVPAPDNTEHVAKRARTDPGFPAELPDLPGVDGVLSLDEDQLLEALLASKKSCEELVQLFPNLFPRSVPTRSGGLLAREWDPHELVRRICASSLSQSAMLALLPTGFEWDKQAKDHFVERFGAVQLARMQAIVADEKVVKATKDLEAIELKQSQEQAVQQAELERQQVQQQRAIDDSETEIKELEQKTEDFRALLGTFEAEQRSTKRKATQRCLLLAKDLGLDILPPEAMRDYAQQIKGFLDKSQTDERCAAVNVIQK